MSYIDWGHQAQWQPCWHYKTPTSRDLNHSRRRRWALEVQAAGEAEMCPNLIPLCLKGIREQDRNKMHIWTLGRCSKDEEKELLLTTGLLMQVLSSRSVVLWKCHKLSLQNMIKTKKTCIFVYFSSYSRYYMGQKLFFRVCLLMIFGFLWSKVFV